MLGPSRVWDRVRGREGAVLGPDRQRRSVLLRHAGAVTAVDRSPSSVLAAEHPRPRFWLQETYPTNESESRESIRWIFSTARMPWPISLL